MRRKVMTFEEKVTTPTITYTLADCMWTMTSILWLIIKNKNKKNQSSKVLTDKLTTTPTDRNWTLDEYGQH